MTLLRKSGAPYLSTLYVAVVATLGAHYLVPHEAILKGQSVSVLTAYLAVAVALLLWVPLKTDSNWPLAFHWFMASLTVTWLGVIGMSIWRGDMFDLTALLVPVILIMIWVKRPSRADALLAADAFAWALVAVAMIAQLLHVTGIHELRFESWIRWPLLGDLLPPIQRWEGPFGNVNAAGPIGAFLLVYGLFRGRLVRLVLVTAGAMIIVASNSRTSLLACGVGLVVALLVVPSIGRFRVSGWLKAVAALGLIVMAAGYVLLIDPSLNGRMRVWGDLLGAWADHPFWGLGGTGVSQEISRGTVAAVATHGHSLYIDALARYGILGIVVIGSALCAALVLGISAARGGSPVSIAVVAVVMSSGLSEDLIDWRYLGYQAIPLVAACVVAASSDAAPRRDAEVYCESH